MKPRKIRTRDNITIATWNMRTLSQTGKLQKLTHELERYNWHIVGFCEVLWEDLGEHLSDKGDILYYSGDLSSHVHGIGFLVNKNAKNSVPGCPPISKRIITIHLRAAPFNITVVQAYGPTTEYDNEQVEEFYSQLQDSFDKVEKKDLLIIQGDWNAKVGEDTMKEWRNCCGTSCNATTNERGLRLLKFTSYNDLVLENTLDDHKTSRCWTWHCPNGTHHQIDYIMVQSRFQSGINRAKTRTFPGADVEVIMTW